LIERIEKVARITGWNTDARKCDEFHMCLRDGAMSRYSTLENIIGFNIASWADTKSEFMKAYAPRYTAFSLCTNFQDLQQKQDQTVQDFYNHVSDVFRDSYQAKPAHVLTCPAERHGLTQAQGDELRLGGIMAMQLLMMNMVYIGGFREEIRVKVLDTGPT
jgi:hypothetical protein